MDAGDTRPRCVLYGLGAEKLDDGPLADLIPSPKAM